MQPVNAVATSYQYWMPTRVVFGDGALSRLPEVVDDSAARVLVIATGSMGRLGVLDRVEDMLGRDRTVLYGHVSPSPTPEVVDEVTAVCRDEGCDAVVAIGGGSAIDVGKCVAILQANPGDTRDYLMRKVEIETPGVPFVAVPTTAGTGSEVTPWATVWDMEVRRKYSLEHRWMFPTASLVDPSLTSSLPPYQTATSGMDALTQAVEAYWSRNSQPVSDMYALAAVRKIFGSLEDACNAGGATARSAMAEGSLLSGLAFSNTKTTICHSLSYPMSAHFDVPHGQAVSITLAPMLEWNAEAISDRLQPLLEAMGATSVDEASSRIRSLMTGIGLATDLRSMGLDRDDVELILEEGFYADRADHNPRQVTVEDAREILYGIY